MIGETLERTLLEAGIVVAHLDEGTLAVERTERGAHELVTHVTPNRCEICGCSDLRACDGGCHWVDEGLCSQCAVIGGYPVVDVDLLAVQYTGGHAMGVRS